MCLKEQAYGALLRLYLTYLTYDYKCGCFFLKLYYMAAYWVSIKQTNLEKLYCATQKKVKLIESETKHKIRL